MYADILIGQGSYVEVIYTKTDTTTVSIIGNLVEGNGESYLRFEYPDDLNEDVFPIIRVHTGAGSFLGDGETVYSFANVLMTPLSVFNLTSKTDEELLILARTMDFFNNRTGFGYHRAGSDDLTGSYEYHEWYSSKIYELFNKCYPYPWLYGTNYYILKLKYYDIFYQEDEIFDKLLTSEDEKFEDVRATISSPKKFKCLYAVVQHKTDYKTGTLDTSTTEFVAADDGDYNIQKEGYINFMVEVYTINPLSSGDDVMTSEFIYGDDGVGDIIADINWQKFGRYAQNVESINTSKYLYLSCATDGLMWFDKETNNQYSAFGTDANIAKSVYQPNAYDLLNVGFNVLAPDPLHWVDSEGITTKSIQGLFLTIYGTTPLSVVPTAPSQVFQINVIYTGDFGTATDILTLTLTVNGSVLSSTTDYKATINTTLTTDGVIVYDVYFLTQHTVDLEIKVKFNATYNPSNLYPEYIDYYSWGTPSSTAKEITNLNVGGYGLIEINSRAVFYANNTIWFSELNKYNYIPNYNYVNLDLSDSDEIVKIKFFRTSYIIFTKEKIFKMEGTFGTSDFSVSLINDTVGCLAKNTVKVVGSKMIFLSTVGLKALVLDKFRVSLENLEDMDLNIQNYTALIPEYSEAFTYNDDYYLLTNQGDITISETKNGKTINLPDVIVYKSAYDVYSFMTYAYDRYGHKVKPGFIYSRRGKYYMIEGESFSQFDYGYNDIGYTYSSIFQTVSTNMGYPLHQKKIKNVIIKVSGGDVSQPIYVELYANGSLVKDTYMRFVVQNADGTLTYEEIQDPSAEIPESANVDSSTIAEKIALLGKMVLNVSPVGSSQDIVRKLTLSTKCKNVSIRVTTTEPTALNVLAIGYTYKLGKVKE